MKVTATHAICVSRMVETVLTPDPVHINPGDLVCLADVPALKALMERTTANPVFFTPYKALARRGQMLVCAGPTGLRGYKVGGPNPPPEDKLPREPFDTASPKSEAQKGK